MASQAPPHVPSSSSSSPPSSSSSLLAARPAAEALVFARPAAWQGWFRRATQNTLFAVGFALFLNAVAVISAVVIGIANPRRFVNGRKPRDLKAAAARVNDPALGTHGFVTVNGVRLHYVSKGEGPLLLFLHGFPQFWYVWAAQLQRYSAKYRCVALDMRGYNDSEKPVGVAQYDLDILADDVRGLVEALGYRTCTIVAHDWGGVVAWHVAALYPQLLERLVVVNAPQARLWSRNVYSFPQLLKSAYVFFFQLPRIPEFILSNYGYAPMRQALRSYPKEEVDCFTLAISKPGALTAMLNYYRARSRKPKGSSRTDGRVKGVRVLLIWGDNDEALGWDMNKGLAEIVTDLQVVRIPDGTHWCIHTKPDAFHAALDAFLSSPSPSRS